MRSQSCSTKALPRRLQDSRFLYVFANDRHIKIGVTSDPLRRRREINRQNRFKKVFSVVKIFDLDTAAQALEIEQAVHYKSGIGTKVSQKREYYLIGSLPLMIAKIENLIKNLRGKA